MFLYKKNYSLSFILSLLAHLLLFLILFSTVVFNSYKPYVIEKGTTKKIVNATTVNQKEVQQEVTRLKQQQEQKRLAEINHIKHLQNLAENAQKLRINELKHLQVLKQNQALLKKQQLAEQKTANEHLAQIKQQQLQEQKKLTELEHKQSEAQNNYKLQQQKLAALQKKQKAMELKKKQTQDVKALLAQQLKQEQLQLAKAKQKYIDGIINKYIALVRQSIQNNWIEPPNVNPDMTVTLQINTTKNGTVNNVKIIKSSGDTALDQSATLAVYKASPLPIPVNKPIVAKQFKIFTLTIHPLGISTVG